MERLHYLLEDLDDWHSGAPESVRLGRMVERNLDRAWFTLGGRSGHEVKIVQFPPFFRAVADYERFYDSKQMAERLLALGTLDSDEIILQAIDWFIHHKLTALSILDHVHKDDFSWMQLEMELAKEDTREAQKAPGKLIKFRWKERLRYLGEVTRQFITSNAAAHYLTNRFIEPTND